MNRSEPNAEKNRVALVSVAGALGITGLKLGVGLWTGSLGLLSESAHSGLDLIAAIVTLLAVRFSARPADKTHLYGHGKVENFSALFETLLLLVTCAWIINEAIDRLFFHTVDVEVNVWSFAVMFVSIAVDSSRSRALYRVARKYKSQALEADALHFRTDIWSSSVVILGLILTLIHVPVADSIAALIVALIVIVISLQLGKRTIDELLDRAPSGVEERMIAAAERLDGVEKADNVRVRNSGSRMFVDLTLHLRRTLPFERVNETVHQVEKELRGVFPNADFVIHPEPVETPDESIADKVKLMMSHDGLAAHDVQVFNVGGRYQVEFQLEFASARLFEEVHTVVDGIEARIKHDIPAVSSVVVHIEDSREQVVDSIDVTSSSSALINNILAVAAGEPSVRECEVVSVLSVGGRFRISMKCRVDRTMALEEVHAASTRLEQRIMVSLPEIIEVIIHAEPAP